MKRRNPSTSADTTAALIGRDGGVFRGGSQAAQQSDLTLASEAWSEKAFDRRLGIAKDAEEVKTPSRNPEPFRGCRIGSHLAPCCQVSRLIIAASSRFNLARAAVAAHRIASLSHVPFNLDRSRAPERPGAPPLFLDAASSARILDIQATRQRLSIQVSRREAISSGREFIMDTISHREFEPFPHKQGQQMQCPGQESC